MTRRKKRRRKKYEEWNFYRSQWDNLSEKREKNCAHEKSLYFLFSTDVAWVRQFIAAEKPSTGGPPTHTHTKRMKNYSRLKVSQVRSGEKGRSDATKRRSKMIYPLVWSQPRLTDCEYRLIVVKHVYSFWYIRPTKRENHISLLR